MHEDEFWELVDSTRTDADGDSWDQAEALVERLAGLDPESVTDFARHFEARFRRAYRWDVWAASRILLDDPGEDAFDAFRCWLVAQGREVFEGAMHQGPDVLAELLPDFDEEYDGDGEEIGYAADEAHEQLTGSELPELGGVAGPEEPLGTPLDPEDGRAVAELLPALWKRFRG